MSDVLTNFATRDTKYNFILLFGLLIIFAICIVNAVDFRKVAIDNDTVSDTYFSVSYANGLAVTNGLIAFFVLLGIAYITWKIIRGQKDIKELEKDKAAMDILQAFVASSSVPNISITSSSGLIAAGAPATATTPGPLSKPSDFFAAFGVPNNIGFNQEGVSVSELKEVARISGLDINKYKNKCSDGNTQLLCNPKTADDVNLNNLYNVIY
jgi:hypothetical protein